MGQSWISLEAALQRLLENVPTPPAESVPLAEALRRVCAKPVRATLPAPPFDRSPLDGYALHSTDVAGATAHTPARLPVTQEVFAGDRPRSPLPPGQAARIMTGAMLPPGADCVIRQEDVVAEGRQIQLFRPLAHNENLIFTGEDIAAGEVLVQLGDTLRPTQISLLAGQGATQADVYKKPCVAVVSTGSELSLQGQPLAEGKIYDSNSWLLASRVTELGAQLHTRAVLGDEPDLLFTELDRLLNSVDLLLTTGGVSVGAKDFLPAVAERLGGQLLFHGVDVKPGSPALGLTRRGKIMLCFSGNPFAALATFEVLAVPVLKKMSGESACQLKRVQCVAQDAFSKKSPGRRLVRARMEGGAVYIPKLGHASGMLHSFQGCNCLMDVPAGNEGIQKSDLVEVFLLE